MKKLLETKIALFVIAFLTLNVITVKSQDIKPRISTGYYKTMGESPQIMATVKYKEEKVYHPASLLDLNVYSVATDDSLVLVGTTTTDQEGIALFDIQIPELDSIVQYQYLFKIENNEKFADAEKSVKFVDTNLNGSIFEEDSIVYLNAILTSQNGEPVEGAKLSLWLQRLFAALPIGESSYKTDEEGTISIAMEERYLGVDGNLTFELLLENRKYGNVTLVLESDLGEHFTDESTFDQRTMWSPPEKTPFFILIFPNLVILGIWLTIIILAINLFKISKS